MRKHPWFIALLCFLCFGAGVVVRAQTDFTPAQPTTITDPSQVWLKVDHPSVTMKVRVNKEGRVDKVLSNTVSPPLRPFYEWAAKNEWRFTPAMVGDQPVASDVTVELLYKVEFTHTVLSCVPTTK